MIVFVKMLNDEGNLRDSYRDYWTMVLMSGYATCLLGEIDYQSENVYLFSPDDGNSTAAFTSEKATNRRCKLVFVQLEWPMWVERDAEGTIIQAGHLTGYTVPHYVDQMWVCDPHYFELQKRFNPVQIEKIQYLFIGGHPDFGNPDHAKRTCRWDFAPLSYNYGVREHKLNILLERGFTIAPNTWDEEREYVLRNSRWGLHLQQFPMPFIAPQRFLLFASYGLPIISDYCAAPEPYIIFQDGLIHWDPRETSLMNDVLRREAVEHNFNLVRVKKTFKSQVDVAVEILLSSNPFRMNALQMSPDDMAMARMHERRIAE